MITVVTMYIGVTSLYVEMSGAVIDFHLGMAYGIVNESVARKEYELLKKQSCENCSVTSTQMG